MYYVNSNMAAQYEDVKEEYSLLLKLRIDLLISFIHQVDNLRHFF